jgi:hypothetical protein
MKDNEWINVSVLSGRERAGMKSTPCSKPEKERGGFDLI